MNKLEIKLLNKLDELQNNNLLRKRNIIETDGVIIKVLEKEYINFSSNDYLGLASGTDYFNKNDINHNCGGASSPLITGYSLEHYKLEQELCKHTGYEAALLFSSGFSANNALMQLFNADELIVCDKLIHTSIIEGAQKRKLRLRRFLHNNLMSAQKLLELKPSALITESVFSMDGDCAPLIEMRKLCKNTIFIVDDAHGFGIFNNHKLADIQIITFGKALGSQGAAILGSKIIVDYLVATAKEYIYSTALSPLLADITLHNIKKIYANNILQTKLYENICLFKKLCIEFNVTLLNSDSPIQIILIPMDKLDTFITLMKNSGFWVVGIRPPTVVYSRIRLTITSNHTKEHIETLVISLSNGLKKVGLNK